MTHTFHSDYAPHSRRHSPPTPQRLRDDTVQLLCRCFGMGQGQAKIANMSEVTDAARNDANVIRYDSYWTPSASSESARRDSQTPHRPSPQVALELKAVNNFCSHTNVDTGKKPEPLKRGRAKGAKRATSRQGGSLSGRKRTPMSRRTRTQSSQGAAVPLLGNQRLPSPYSPPLPLCGQMEEAEGDTRRVVHQTAVDATQIESAAPQSDLTGAALILKGQKISFAIQTPPSPLCNTPTSELPVQVYPLASSTSARSPLRRSVQTQALARSEGGNRAHLSASYGSQDVGDLCSQEQDPPGSFKPLAILQLSMRAAALASPMLASPRDPIEVKSIERGKMSLARASLGSQESTRKEARSSLPPELPTTIALSPIAFQLEEDLPSESSESILPAVLERVLPDAAHTAALRRPLPSVPIYNDVKLPSEEKGMQSANMRDRGPSLPMSSDAQTHMPPVYQQTPQDTNTGVELAAPTAPLRIKPLNRELQTLPRESPHSALKGKPGRAYAMKISPRVTRSASPHFGWLSPKLAGRGRVKPLRKTSLQLEGSPPSRDDRRVSRPKLDIKRPSTESRLSHAKHRKDALMCEEGRERLRAECDPRTGRLGSELKKGYDRHDVAAWLKQSSDQML